MLLKIEHLTHYRYTEPVFLEPHYLYQYPNYRTYYRVQDYDLRINPAPSGQTLKQDPENNFCHQVWFNEMVEELEIKVSLAVKVQEYNPFEFFLESWPQSLHPALSPYLQPSSELGNPIQDWYNAWGNNISHEPVAFLDQLIKETNSNFDHEIRYESHLLEPNDCFQARAGSCRDLSWMLIQILRKEGIPARFVSGYAHNPELEEGHELHAWLEAWLPGAGWIGLDPSAGIFTNHEYIPVAVSYLPKNTLPVQGTYRGEAQSQMETRVVIEEGQ